MFANIWLKQNRENIIAWPETTMGESSTIRADYLRIMISADVGDYEQLIQLHQKYMK